MGQKTTPPKSIPKTTSPPRVRRRNTYNRVTALAKHVGKTQETLGYSFDTKKFGKFLLKKSKTAILFRRIPLDVFFLPKCSLSSRGGNTRFL